MLFLRSRLLSTFGRSILMASGLGLMFAIGYNFNSIDLNIVERYFQTPVKPNNSLLNIEHFDFVVNPKHICPIGFRKSDKGRRIITVIHSARGNFRKRKIVRKTFATVKEHKGWTTQMIFTLGLASLVEDPKIQGELDKEIRENQDIVIGNFVDTYRNMSYKHLAGYKWAVEFCPEASYYLKSDDDMLVDIFHVIEYLSSSKSATMDTDYYCYRNDEALARNSSKWMVTRQEYPHDTYPSFCGIAIYVTPIQTVKRVLSVSNMQDFLWLDDVFVTGILRERANKNVTAKTINVELAKIYLLGAKTNESFVWRESFLGILFANQNRTCELWNSILQFREVVNEFTSSCTLLF